MIELKNSKTTYLGKASDGKRDRYHLECHIGAIQMKEEDVWYDIDPTLDKNGLPKRVPYIVTPYLTGMPGFHYKSKQSGEFDIRLREARSISLTGLSTIVQPRIPTPIIVGKQIIWREAYLDTDVVLQFGNTRVSLKRILKSAKAPTEYDIDSTVLEEGIAQILPIRPAIDALGQSLVMEETKIDGGRTESLKLEVMLEEGDKLQPITYPIEDAYDIELQVAASLDDTYDDGVTNNETSDQLRAGYSARTIGMRWDNVTVPNGATIDNCFVDFYILGTSYDDPNNDIDFEAADDPVNFHDDNAFASARSLTGNPVDWTDTGLGTGFELTPSLSTPCKAVVDRGGWASGQAMVVIIGPDKSASTLRGRSYDYAGNVSGPKLYIDYTAAVAGWTGGDVNGVAIAAIAKINGIAVADIKKVNGIA